MRLDVLITATVVGASLALGGAAAWSFGAGDADSWSGPLAIAALVLLASGVAKVHQPDTAIAAMGAAGLPRSSPLVRVVGAGEIALGTVAVLAGGRIAAAGVALAYVAFAIVAWRMARDPDASSCGCFGRASARPGALHVVTNAIAAVCAGIAVASGAGGLVAVVRDTPGAGIPAVAGIVVGAVGVVAVLTAAAEALAATAGTHSSTTFHLVEDR